MRDVTRSVEPRARAERAVEQQQGLVRQIRNLQLAAPPEPALPRQHGKVVDRIQEAVPEATVGHDQR
jgi:hypothetical protein